MEKYSYSSTPHALSAGKPAPKQSDGGGGQPKYRNDQNLSSTMVNDGRVGPAGGGPKMSKSMDFGAGGGNRGNVGVGAAKARNNRGKQRPAPIVYELEELTDRPIDNQENEVHEESFLMYDEADLPKFVRSVVTVDAMTQIEKNDSNLFDFDHEVKPILEVLVGKTIHIALIELQEEYEMAEILRREEEFEITRMVELGELQRFEAEIKRGRKETLRREAQEAQRLKDVAAHATHLKLQAKLNDEDKTKREAAADTTEYDAIVLQNLKKEIDTQCLDVVLEGVQTGADQYESAAKVAEELLNQAMQLAIDFEEMALKLRRKLFKRQIRAEEKRKRLQLSPAEEAISSLRKTSKGNVTAKFNELDKDGSGTLSLAEMMDVLSGLGVPNLTEKLMEDIFKLCDVDGDGSLNLKEFMHFMMVESPLEAAFRQAREVQIAFQLDQEDRIDDAREEIIKQAKAREEILNAERAKAGAGSEEGGGGDLSSMQDTMASAVADAQSGMAADNSAGSGSPKSPGGTSLSLKPKSFSLKARFAMLDKKGTGTLDQEGALKAFELLHVQLGPDEIEAAMKMFSASVDGGMSYEKVAESYENWLQSQQPPSEAENAIAAIRAGINSLGAIQEGDEGEEGEDAPATPATEGEEGSTAAAGPPLTPRSKMAKLFSEHDKDKSGALSYDELQSCLASMGMVLSGTAMKEMYAYFDVNGSGTIDYDEFLEGVMCTSLMEDGFKAIQVAEGKQKAIFDIHDLLERYGKTAQGRNTKEELVQALASKKVKIPDHIIDLMMNAYDPEKTGSIQVKAFAEGYSTWRASKQGPSAAVGAIQGIRDSIEEAANKLATGGSGDAGDLQKGMLQHLYKVCKRKGFNDSEGGADPVLDAQQEKNIREVLETIGLHDVAAEEIDALVKYFEFNDSRRIDAPHVVTDESTDVPLLSSDEFIEELMYNSHVEDAFQALIKAEAKYKKPISVEEAFRLATEKQKEKMVANGFDPTDAASKINREALKAAFLNQKVVLSNAQLDVFLHKFASANALEKEITANDAHELYEVWRMSKIPPATKESACDAIRKLVTEQKKDLITSFRDFDADKNGSLNKVEMRKALLSLGLNLTDDNYDSLFREFDSDGNGVVNYSEFSYGVMVESSVNQIFRKIRKQAATSKTKLDLRTPFSKFDSSGDNQLTKREFQMALFDMKVRVSEENMDAVFKHFDPDESGTIAYHEFVRQFFNKNQLQLKPKLKTIKEGETEVVVGDEPPPTD